MALTDKLADIADAIRAKTGKIENMTIDEMPAEIEEISETSVGINLLNMIIDRSITSFSSDITRVRNNAFYGCNILTSISLPSATRIGNYAFYDCNKLTRLVLRSETVCTCVDKSLFEKAYHFLGTVDSTYNPKGLKDGYIYVPSALVEDYKVATNWSTYADRFRALEDFTVDGSITGELDDEKIAAADAAEASSTTE